MSEPKADYLTAQFLAAAGRVKHVEHNLYCETCAEETDHDLNVRGSLEIYVCPVCGNSQTFRTK